VRGSDLVRPGTWTLCGPLTPTLSPHALRGEGALAVCRWINGASQIEVPQQTHTILLTEAHMPFDEHALSAAQANPMRRAMISFMISLVPA